MVISPVVAPPAHIMHRPIQTNNGIGIKVGVGNLPHPKGCKVVHGKLTKRARDLGFTEMVTYFCPK